jgi:murein L,D-transpeptidase YcbB/YkuD
MRINRITCVFAGTVALAMTAGGVLSASAQDNKATEAPQATSAVPMPEPANVPPPTAADVGSAPATAANVPSETTSAPTTTGSTEQPKIQQPATAQAQPAAPEQAASPAPQTPAAANSAPPATSEKPASDTATAPTATPPADTAATPATQTPAVAATVPAMDPKDAAVADALRGIINGKFDRVVDRRNERDAISTFYQARDFKPIWSDKGIVTPRAEAAMKRIRKADDDGLEASDFVLPKFAADADPAALANADIQLTKAFLLYAREARIGRLTASRVTANADYKQTPVEPAEILNNLASHEDVAAYLESFNPQFHAFQALRAKLIEIRAGNAPAKTHIAEGKTIQIGNDDDRIPAIRQRLNVRGEADANNYDKALAEAVKSFQREHGMRPDGLIGDRTIQALNGGPKTASNKIETIVANLERLRWLPHDLGNVYVMVNLPDYSLKVVKNGKTTWTTRIVVGKPSMATPIFSNAIENIVVNPTWHVPQSIVQKEYLPALAQDPTVLARAGLVVHHERDGTISITQPPGNRNALGHMKFNFPNKFNVYLHDTPDKNLFKASKRAFSHGCMRVLNPWDFGEQLAEAAIDHPKYTAARFKSMFGDNEHWLKFDTKIPVHLTYQTAFVDDENHLQFRPDIYGYDNRVDLAMKNPGRNFASADVQAKHQEAASARRVSRRQIQQAETMPRQVPSFFDLFR